MSETIAISRGIIKSEAYMSSLGKLILVLIIALTVAIVGLSKKLADAKVKSIQQTIEQQFNEGVDQ